MMTTIAAALAAGTSTSLLAIAAHELGHAIAFQQAGIPVRDVVVWLHHRQTDHWKGQTEPAVEEITPDLLPGWQIVLLAGEAATYRYLRQHAGFTHSDATVIAEKGAAQDLATYRSTRGGLSLAQARKQAAALVADYSRRIDGLTVRLATARRLPGSAL